MTRGGGFVAELTLVAAAHGQSAAWRWCHLCSLYGIGLSQSVAALLVRLFMTLTFERAFAMNRPSVHFLCTVNRIGERALFYGAKTWFNIDFS